MSVQIVSAVELLPGELVFPLGAGQSPFVVLDVDDAVVLAPGDLALSVR